MERTILNSWKQIAMYVGRGVRTVQRYESQFGFPVRRPAGMFRSSVMAFSDEIDAWLNRTPRGREQTFNHANGSISFIKISVKQPQSSEYEPICPVCQGTGKIPNSDGGRVIKHGKASHVA